MCQHENRHDAMVTVGHTPNGRAIFCDPCIAPLIQALNAAGLATVASCCGHGRQPGWIALDDGREMLLVTEDQRNRICELFPEVNAPLPLVSECAVFAPGTEHDYFCRVCGMAEGQHPYRSGSLPSHLPQEQT